jgi:hypothetical protein
MPDLQALRAAIAALECPYPGIVPFREGWECHRAQVLAIIDAAIAPPPAPPEPTIHGRTYKIDGYIEGDRFYVQSTQSPVYVNCLDAEGWWVYEVSKWALFPTIEAAEAFAEMHTDRVSEAMKGNEK